MFYSIILYAPGEGGGGGIGAFQNNKDALKCASLWGIFSPFRGMGASLYRIFTFLTLSP